MLRRCASGSSVIASTPSMSTRPEVGSISRLIIFIVVVLPQPDGPTSTTISPAGISIVTWSTAGAAWPGYCLVNSSSTMVAHEELAVLLSDTDSPGRRNAADEQECNIEKYGQHHDADRADEHLVQRIDRAEPVDAVHDLPTEAGAVDVRTDCGDADNHFRGDPDAGDYDRPRDG